MTARPLEPATRVVRRFSHEIGLHDDQQVPCVPKSWSKDNQYQVSNCSIIFRLKHAVICLLVTARAYLVRRIALLFLSRCS